MLGLSWGFDPQPGRLSMEQVIQVVGAVLILVAFAAAQAGAMSQHSVTYLVLNIVGSLVLAVLAVLGPNYGFLLLEGVWTAVSVWSLWRVLTGRRVADPGSHAAARSASRPSASSSRSPSSSRRRPSR
jgi:hypothetical protein